MIQLEQYRKERAKLIDQILNELVPAETNFPSKIYDAMRYSLFAGGKRLRGILMMAAADACGSDGTNFLKVAAGIEMLHCFAIIHDDLPSIDDDAFRRGKPTNHKVYGDGLALLAGDALHSLGFLTILSQQDEDPQLILEIAKDIAETLGPEGYAGGQALDLACRTTEIDDASMEFLHRSKKGSLFRAAIRAGGTLAGAKDRYVAALGRFADHYGTAFQITDDILDVSGTIEKTGKSLGSDIRQSTITYVSQYTLEGARKRAQNEVDQAIDALNQFDEEADILRNLARFLLVRDF